MGGGRENAGCWFELPAESVRGGGLMPSRPFCILRGPTVGVCGLLSAGRKKSSSSGRPCLRPSISQRCSGYVRVQLRYLIARDDRCCTYFWLRRGIAQQLKERTAVRVVEVAG